MYYKISDQSLPQQLFLPTMHYPGFPPVTEEQSYQLETDPTKSHYQQVPETLPIQQKHFSTATTEEQSTVLPTQSFLHYPSCYSTASEVHNYQKEFLDPQYQHQAGYSNVMESETAESCTDDYNCKCDSCQNKYGSLPILLQGIEQKSFGDKSDQEPSTSASSSSKRILTCEYCNKTFTHKGDFKKHLRKHTKEKPFPCKYCSKSFGNTSNLLRHQKLHTGEKPFACEHCGKKFSRKDKLDCHRRSRTCQEAGTSSSYV